MVIGLYKVPRLSSELLYNCVSQAFGPPVLTLKLGSGHLKNKMADTIFLKVVPIDAKINTANLNLICLMVLL